MKIKLTHNSDFVTFFPRVIAFVIDEMIWLLPTLWVLWRLSTITHLEDILVEAIRYFFLILVPVLFISALSYPILISRWGTTIGKWLIGAKITKEDGSLLTFKEAIAREWFAKQINTVVLRLSYLLVLFHPKHQGLHDQVVGSYVRNTKQRVLVGVTVLLVLFAIVGYASWNIFNGFATNTSLQHEIREIFTVRAE